MHLKAIDIFGYKSFALKTHLDLGIGITGIVGPNGCGKSNIMESVRWCLGESSWKSLRADSMTDVIFAGTARKPALSFSEVTLTFDNASQGLPVAFSEVTVSRRLFRSGESLYFLNKSQCRLKDVRDLFLDTGLGSGGYAIIDQGRVESMISAKPDERRAFFEEAAGVAKYNARRAEALKKLEHVEADMARIQDAQSLIGDQVKKLDSDAKKAKLFQKYKEELSAAEAGQILKEIARLEAALEEERAKRTPLEESLGQKKVEIDVEGAQISALNLEHASAQSEAIETGKKSAELKSNIARLEERIQSWERESREAVERVQALQAEEVGLQEKNASLSEELNQAYVSLEKLDGDLQSCRQEAEGEASRLEDLSKRVFSAQSEWEEAGKKALHSSENVLAARRKISDLESDRTRAEARTRSLLREYGKIIEFIGASSSDIATVRAALEDISAVVSSGKEENSKAQESLENKRREEQQLGDETFRLHSRFAETQAHLKALESRGGQDPYWVGAQVVLGANIPGVIGMVRSLFEADEDIRLHLGDILGEKLYAVVCDDSIAARNAIEFLEASGRGRCRLLVLSSISESSREMSYPESAKPLLSKIKFAPNHERLIRFLLAESYALGRTVFSDHWVCGGAPPAEGEPLSLADISRLKSDLESTGKHREEIQTQRSAALGAIKELEDHLHAVSRQLTESLGKQQALGAQLSEKESVLSSRQKESLISETEALEGLREIAGISEKISELRENLKETLAAETEARRAQEESFQKFSAVKEKFVEEKAKQGTISARLEALEGQAANLKASCERFEREKLTNEEAISRSGVSRSTLTLRSEDCVSKAAQARQELEGLYRDLSLFENASTTVLEKLHQIEAHIHQREEALRLIKESAASFQEELHKLDILASASRSSLDGLKTRLWDQWQITYDEAKAKYADQEVDLERLEFLRKRLNSLGHVNMAAPEEYEALTQKQSFLTSQIEDISRARDDLKHAIQTINDSTRENFRNTFSEIREEFRKLYGILFEGGEADLVLSDPENILETGIEIMAQPPGKRLQSLSLLSGGEKALTAIALLFAFFMVRPSPFCMLDEADAALDDANVERFVGLLKEFETRTQFLIASHNKRTMEAASAIYGVTMEELGISQLISVDFKPKNAPARQELPAQTLPESEPQLEAVAVGVASNPSERESSSTVAEEESKILSESGSVDSNSGSQS